MGDLDFKVDYKADRRLDLVAMLKHLLWRPIAPDWDEKILEPIGELKRLSPRIEVIDITPKMLSWLREDPKRLSRLTPDKFEDFIANRLRAMGYEVQEVGGTYTRDGGIDLLACPSNDAGYPHVLATQVKHRSKGGSVGSSDVRDFRGTIDIHPIDIGMIVTNTSFTMDAKWFAAHAPRVLRLRDFDHLTHWLADEFSNELVWNEIPDFIELAPGLTIEIPKNFGAKKGRDRAI